MKVTPRANYPVRVRPHAWEEDEALADLYEGIFSMTLNRVVDIAFVPDVSAAAPPWDGRQLPADLDHVSTVEQARIGAVLTATYAITPNEPRAGTLTRLRFPPEQEEPELSSVVVRYVTADEFADFAAELAQLMEILGGLYSDTTVSELRDYAVVRFVEREVVSAPWLLPHDAAILGRGVPAGPS